MKPIGLPPGSRIEASTIDTLLGLAHRILGDITMGGVIETKQRFDAELLAKAVRISFDLVPHMGCRFVVDEKEAYFERLSAIEDKEILQTVQDDSGIEFNKIVRTSIPHEIGPLARFWLCRGEAGDKLVIKLSHIAADGAGSVEYVGKMAGIYRRLRQNPDYFPDKAEESLRSMRAIGESVISRFGTDAIVSILKNGLSEIGRALWRLDQPYIPYTRAQTRKSVEYVIQHLEGDRFAELDELRKRHNATVNDALMAAFHRALVRMDPNRRGKPVDMASTIDLRKYLLLNEQRLPNDANTIASLTGFIFTSLEDPGDDFIRTMLAYREEMARHKQGLAGLGLYGYGPALAAVMPLWMQSAVIRQIGARLPFLPIFSNAGNIPRQVVDFGEEIVIDRAYAIPVTIFRPKIMVACNGFDRRMLSLSCGFYPPETRREDVERLFEIMFDQFT